MPNLIYDEFILKTEIYNFIDRYIYQCLNMSIYSFVQKEVDRHFETMSEIYVKEAQAKLENDYKFCINKISIHESKLKDMNKKLDKVIDLLNYVVED